jgi:hypothetical protein
MLVARRFLGHKWAQRTRQHFLRLISAESTIGAMASGDRWCYAPQCIKTNVWANMIVVLGIVDVLMQLVVVMVVIFVVVALLLTVNGASRL